MKASNMSKEAEWQELSHWKKLTKKDGKTPGN